MRNKAVTLYGKVAKAGKQHKMFPTSNPYFQMGCGQLQDPKAIN